MDRCLSSGVLESQRHGATRSHPSALRRHGCEHRPLCGEKEPPTRDPRPARSDGPRRRSPSAVERRSPTSLAASSALLAGELDDSRCTGVVEPLARHWVAPVRSCTRVKDGAVEVHSYTMQMRACASALGIVQRGSTCAPVQRVVWRRERGPAARDRRVRDAAIHARPSSNFASTRGPFLASLPIEAPPSHPCPFRRILR